MNISQGLDLISFKCAGDYEHQIYRILQNSTETEDISWYGPLKYGSECVWLTFDLLTPEGSSESFSFAAWTLNYVCEIKQEGFKVETRAEAGFLSEKPPYLPRISFQAWLTDWLSCAVMTTYIYIYIPRKQIHILRKRVRDPISWLHGIQYWSEQIICLHMYKCKCSVPHDTQAVVPKQTTVFQNSIHLCLCA